jgi:hypothetical protein
VELPSLVTLDESVVPVECNYKNADGLAADAAAPGYPNGSSPSSSTG